jgi:hypothetical protein
MYESAVPPAFYCVLFIIGIGAFLIGFRLLKPSPMTEKDYVQEFQNLFGEKPYDKDDRRWVHQQKMVISVLEALRSMEDNAWRMNISPDPPAVLNHYSRAVQAAQYFGFKTV